jgi:serine/threonine protein kinase
MPTSNTPPRQAADRNLLFGILALQMDFISRDALIAAMHAWVLEKAKPLGQVLLEQGTLSAEARDGLERLVELHVAAHRGEPERSLAALQAPPTVRGELGRIADPDLRDSLAHVPVAPPEESAPPTRHDGAPSSESLSGADTYRTPSYYSVGAMTSAGLRFRVPRPHAEGGLGKVSVALDDELHREVALKEIQEKYADHPHSRARFVREAEVTGGLEHPGVVPVYGLGCHADGRPFYAMRLIQGASLQEAVKAFHAAEVPSRDPGERGLALRGLLRRFVDVCNAVAYAHSRGVLHRDLKPANVMLGPFGETLVVDWGLAKPTGESPAEGGAQQGPLRPASAGGAAPTQAGAAIGTPAYMPPEQAAGRLEGLGPASDVYSLGATLYHLLTGQAPFTQSDVGAVLRAVQRGDFPPPRQVKPAVPAGLAAACLKAMALRPQDRYASARLLADDVEHWLADEPVGAWREPRRIRARRWLGRHRTLVTSTAAAVLVAVALLAGATALLAAANGRERQARQDAQRNEREANELRGKEQEARQLADANGKAAAEQRDLALRTLHDVIFEIQRGMRDRPKLHDLRQKLLRKAQAGLQRVARSAATSNQIDRVMGAAHDDMGDIFLLLGDTKLAQAQYQEGHRISSRLAAADPASALAQRDLSVSYNKVGDVSLQLGDARAARDAYREGLKIARKLAEADTDNAVARRDLALSCIKVGNVALRLGDARAAREAYREALDICRRLAEADPDSAKAQGDLAVACEKVGYVGLELGEVRAASDAYREGLKIARKRAEADPDSAEARRALSSAHSKVGDAALRLGEVRAARDAYREALEVARQRAQADPDNAVARRELAVSCHRVADVSLELGEVREAHETYREALGMFRQLAEADPASAVAQRDLSVALNKVGATALRLGEVPAARDAYREALGIRRKLAEADPDNAVGRRDVALSCINVGDVALRLGDAPGARDAYREALGIHQQLADVNPASARAQTDLGISHHKLGWCQQRDLQFEEAAACYGRALDVFRRLEQAGKLQGQPQFARQQQLLKQRIAFCQAAPRAIAYLDFALKQPPALVPGLLDVRVRALARAGRHADAAATADRLHDRDPRSAANLYNAACAYAVCVTAVAPGKPAEQLSAEEKAARERYAARAVAVLREAVGRGFKDAVRVKAAADLETLCGREDFKKLLVELEAKSKAAPK